MEAKFVLIIMGYFVISCEGLDVLNIFESKDPDASLNSIQFIKKYGYPAEAHTVQTIDGYLLQMHRIPHGRNSSALRNKPPVFLQHGFLSSSFDFLVIGPEQGLAFILADMGYDVWLGNVRGNTYSRAHITLNPDDIKFWDFSWHESGVYDLSAEIDYILNYTRHEKIIYMGYSMGTTMFLVLTSMLPQYNEKIEASMLMAIAGYLDHIKSPFIRLLVPIVSQFTWILQIITHGELFGAKDLTDLLGTIFCNMNLVEQRLCTSAMFLLTGSDYQEFNQSLITVLNSHYPSSYSLKALKHFAQIIISNKFQLYDYGWFENYQQYGYSTPPEYPLERITVPMYVYVGKNDYLATVPDALRTAKRLKTLKRFEVIEHTKFSHIDFILSSDVKRQLYDILLNDMTSHLNNL